MESIIKKAIEGGWGNIGNASVTSIDCDSANIDGRFYVHFWENVQSDMFSYNTFQELCNPLFWQALFCPVDYDHVPHEGGTVACEDCKITVNRRDVKYALRFHEINLTEGWDKAVEYLLSTIESK